MIDKRIYTVSLSGVEPVAMISGYKNGQLHVIKCERLPKSLTELKEYLPKKLKKLHKDNFIVLVDEVIPTFSKYGRPCKLSDIGDDGRPIVISSLEQYKNLINLQGITFPANAGGQYEISSSVVDEQRNLNGQLVYHIDWAELRPETVCLLMAVHAASTSSLYDKTAMSSFLSFLGGNKQPSKRQQAFNAITKGYDSKFLSCDGLRKHDHE